MLPPRGDPPKVPSAIGEKLSKKGLWESNADAAA